MVQQLAQVALRGNPHRNFVLHWYRKILRAAFDVEWKSDEDAAYVLQEARMLFRRNMHMTDVEAIERKVREAEMRYDLAVHYKIPYPRPYHFAQHSQPGSQLPYSAYLDSYLSEDVEDGSTNSFSSGSALPGTGMLDNLVDPLPSSSTRGSERF